MATASETFAAGGIQVTVPVEIGVGPTYQLSTADMANPTPVLAAIPSGTAAAPVTVRLPAGEFVTDVACDVWDKAWWNLVGGPTTLRFPTYGPITSGTTYGRRHVRIRRMTDSTITGINVHGPHIGRHPTDPTRAISTVTDPSQARYEFQHGFQVDNCQRVALAGLAVSEVGGDGCYIVDCNDLSIDGLRVEFNGRQGFAAIGGNRWTFNNVEVVNAGRFAIDFEPIGVFADGTPRWVRDVDIANSKLKGGIIYHQVTNVTLRDSELRRGSFIVEPGGSVATNVLLSQQRTGIKILRNVWPDMWTSQTADAGPIRLTSLNGVEVRGNTVNRDPAYVPSRNAPLVDMLSGPINGTVTIRDNVTNLTPLLKWRNFAHSNVTEDVG